jgi:putative membrane protein insertion efficiency factor
MSARRAIATLPLRAYQRVVSPALGARCKYYPSCSEYAAQAIARFGILRGLVLAGWRLLRCNPWSRGGFDPIDAQRVFKPRAPAESA